MTNEAPPIRFGSLIARFKYRYRRFAARRPYLLRWSYSFLKRHRELLVSSQTELVMEGYPRSGNTFAQRAFMKANPTVKVAHHMHAQAQVMRAVELGLPAVVFIRNPDDAVRSMLIRHPHVGARQALKSYIEFHGDLLPMADKILLARFEDVTSDMGSVVDRINRRFNTKFVPFVHSGESESEIFGDMDRANATFYGGLKITHVPRPDRERAKLKQHVSLGSEEKLLQEARDVYEKILRLAASA